MLTVIENVAVVQLLQFLVLVFWLLIVGGVVTARLRLPTTRVEPLLDFLMVAVLVIYAAVLKIYFST